MAYAAPVTSVIWFHNIPYANCLIADEAGLPPRGQGVGADRDLLARRSPSSRPAKALVGIVAGRMCDRCREEAWLSAARPGGGVGARLDELQPGHRSPKRAPLSRVAQGRLKAAAAVGRSRLTDDKVEDKAVGGGMGDDGRALVDSYAGARKQLEIGLNSGAEAGRIAKTDGESLPELSSQLG